MIESELKDESDIVKKHQKKALTFKFDVSHTVRKKCALRLAPELTAM